MAARLDPVAPSSVIRHPSFGHPPSQSRRHEERRRTGYTDSGLDGMVVQGMFNNPSERTTRASGGDMRRTILVLILVLCLTAVGGGVSARAAGATADVPVSPEEAFELKVRPV